MTYQDLVNTRNKITDILDEAFLKEYDYLEGLDYYDRMDPYNDIAATEIYEETIEEYSIKYNINMEWIQNVNS